METRQRSALLVKNEIIFPMFGYAQIIISGLMGYIDDPIAGSSSETELVLRRIPLLGWDKFGNLFRPEGEFTGCVHPHDFVFIEDPDDRKFAALSAAAKVPLVTNDHHLLVHRNLIGFDVLTPRAFLTRAEETASS